MNFVLSGPSLISFSGGRTSAYMLRRILDSYGGRLPPEAHVCFANTGKEHPGTLDFVQECSVRWSVPITWLEFDGSTSTTAYKEVEYATASRSGEPFSLLIDKKQGLPNWYKRFCTTELKVARLHAYMRTRYESWTDIVGLRADEADRVARRARGTDEFTTVYPLHASGITRQQVMSFWRTAEFGLVVPEGLGNCDLCFMKGVKVLRPVIASTPSLANWWIAQEQKTGRTFTSRHSYSWLQQQALISAERLSKGPGELKESVSCHCTD